MSEEQIVLLDEHSLEPIGKAPKLASHHGRTPLHLAFSCWLFDNNNQLLLTKRAITKKVWPGVWTNSFCGHPAPGEDMLSALKRRAAYELGIHHLVDIRVVLPDYRYVTPAYNGIIENEFCPIYFARLDREILAVNPDEVDEYEFLTLQDIRQKINESPDTFSYWFKDQLAILTRRGALQD